MNIRWKVAQAAEIRWWRAYLRSKEPGDYLRQKAEYWGRVLRLAGFEPSPGAVVLDAGCGPAGIFLILKEQEVHAVDPLLDAYRSDLPHFEPSRYPNVQFFALPLENFRPPVLYDTIFCLNAINHVAGLDRSLDVLAGALKPGGRLLLSVDVHNYHFLKKIFQWLPGDVLHPHQYSLEEYKNMLEIRGLEVERTVRVKEGRIFDYFLMVAEKLLGAGR
ncbi:MAG: methyltransferase domain-containing protein [Phaeodactylibacter sp.]|nr:methyltransferase domain-containing protein [Phaeodactylibacter sp.]MCB9053243.1 methyltransferase domain-containing protein [Lewinellaceae bacterium]